MQTIHVKIIKKEKKSNENKNGVKVKLPTNNANKLYTVVVVNI